MPPIFSLEVAASLSGDGANTEGDLLDETNYDAYNNFNAALLTSEQAAAAAGDVLAYAGGDRGGGGGRSVSLSSAAPAGSYLCWRRIGIVDDDPSTSLADEQQVQLPERDAPGQIFLDPAGRHVLCVGANNGDVYHVDTQQVGSKVKPKSLPRLKGIGLTAVGWAAASTAVLTSASAADQQQQPSSAAGVAVGGEKASDIVLGTCTGQLYELTIDSREKSPTPKPLTCQTADAGEPITSVQQRRASTSAAVLMIIAATPTRLYIFTNTGGQSSAGDDSKSLLALAAENLAQCVELPGELGRSELRFHGARESVSSGVDGGGGNGGGDETIAWLAGPGIYHATLMLVPPPNSSNHLAERQLLQYSDLDLGRLGIGDTGDVAADTSALAPQSMALTDFHFLLLYPMNLLAVNRQSGAVVQEINLSSITNSHSPFLTDERMQASYLVVRQPGSQPARLLVVDAYDEARDMWRVHLEKKQFDRALEFASEEQQVVVLDAQAESCFQSHDFERAAIIWGQLVNSAHSSGVTFEEKALRFVEGNCPDALTTYLLTTLDHLHPRRDMSQRTMLGTWITELYLDKLNRAQTATSSAASGGGIDEFQHDAVLEDFRAFLKRYATVLDAKTTKQLLGGGGRISELAFYCEIIGEWERVIDYHLGRRDAEKVLALLRRVGVASETDTDGAAAGNAAAELHYRYAGALMEIDPAGVVDAWIAMETRLEPRVLAPMLMVYGADPSGSHLRSRPGQPAADVDATSTSSRPGAGHADSRREAIRYLEHCVYRLKVRDVAVHNLLLSLYVYDSDGYDHDADVPTVGVATPVASRVQKTDGGGSHEEEAEHPKEEGLELNGHSSGAEAFANGNARGVDETRGSDGTSADGSLAVTDDDSDNVPFDEVDSAIHGEGEASLLNYLNKFAGLGASETAYDVRYALRLCLINGKHRSVVFILCLLGMFEEAIEVALGSDDASGTRLVGGSRRAGTGSAPDHAVGTRDLRLARIVADKPEDDAMRKKLWLRLARDVINENASGANASASSKSENIRRAIAFIRETDGLLKIEDILPFFPDFILIDDFKEAICEALEDYNTDIKDLTRDMDEATRGAELIRRDILNLAERHLELDASTARCASCLCPVLAPPPPRVVSAYGAGLGAAVGGEAFFGFPCGMVFHSECLAKEVCSLATERQRRRVQQLQVDAQRLYSLENGGGLASSSGGGVVGGMGANGGGGADADVQLTEFFGINTNAGSVNAASGAGTSGAGGAGALGSSGVNVLASGDSLAALSSSSLLGDSGTAPSASGGSASSSARSAATTGIASAREQDFSVGASSLAPNASLQDTLDELHETLCCECPFCGDLIIRTIDVLIPPSVGDEDADGDSAAFSARS